MENQEQEVINPTIPESASSEHSNPEFIPDTADEESNIGTRRPNAFEARRQSRIDRLRERADRKRREGESYLKRAESIGKSNAFFHPGTPHPSLNPPPLFSVSPFPLPFILLHSRVPNTRKPRCSYSGHTSPHPTQGCPTFNPPNQPPPRPRSIPDPLLPREAALQRQFSAAPRE